MTAVVEQVKEKLDAGNCRICHDKLSRKRLVRPEYSIIGCSRCGAAQTMPPSFVSQADYDSAPQHASRYAEHEMRFRHYACRMVKQVKTFEPANARWLDVGSSIGIFVDEARRAGFRAKGIDLDTNAIEVGRSLGFPVDSGRLEDQASDSFDILTLSHCLEHISEPAAFLRECRRTLAPGGIIFIVVPCHDSVIARMTPRFWYGWQPAQHYMHYSRRAMTLLFQAAKFTPVASWQESMDHTPRRENIHSMKDVIKSLVTYGLALMGDLCNRGDQLVAVGRKE